MKKHRNLVKQSHLIVVVDDDAAVRKSLKFSLEVEGFVVRTYPRGEELLNESDISSLLLSGRRREVARNEWG